MNKRDIILSLINGGAPPAYTPAAFFLHFDPVYHQGQAAINKHLEFFRHTGMDFVKIQYEQIQPPGPPMRRPEDWANAPLYSAEFFEPTFEVVRGLAQAAKAEEALSVFTVYSPFMFAAQLDRSVDINAHLKENPEAVAKGLAAMTENVLRLVRGCKEAGVDGFYISTQGGEAFRFSGTDIFTKYVKPTDLAIWDEVKSCEFNILHVCDYTAPYDDLTPFLDYPGHVVNSSLHVGDKTLTPKQLSEMFGRPFMGGLERKGTLAIGTPDEIRQAAKEAMADAPDRFILGADCTVPNDTAWDNLKIAVEAAHRSRG